MSLIVATRPQGTLNLPSPLRNQGQRAHLSYARVLRPRVCWPSLGLKVPRPLLRDCPCLQGGLYWFISSLEHQNLKGMLCARLCAWGKLVNKTGNSPFLRRTYTRGGRQFELLSVLEGEKRSGRDPLREGASGVSVCRGSCCKVSSRKWPSSRGMRWRRERDLIWGGGSMQARGGAGWLLGDSTGTSRTAARGQGKEPRVMGTERRKGGRLSGTRQRNLGSSHGKVKGPRKQSCSHCA